MAGNPFQNYLVRFAAGERIFSEGDVGATMFIVQSGKVRLFRTVEGEQRLAGDLEKGDFFGEMSILEGLPRNVTAEASGPVELIEINSMTFDRMIKGNIEIAIRLLRKLSIRLREAERKVDEWQAAGMRAASQQRQSVGMAAQQPSQTTSGVRLEIEEEGVTFPLKDNETLIGRYDPVTELNPDVDLTEVDLKRSVSRRHARVVRSGDSFSVIEEVGALNGTFVNGDKLVAGQPQPIQDGDKLGIGMVKMVFRT
jgi:CRP-like cAMP-binding protein